MSQQNSKIRSQPRTPKGQVPADSLKTFLRAPKLGQESFMEYVSGKEKGKKSNFEQVMIIWGIYSEIFSYVRIRA